MCFYIVCEQCTFCQIWSHIVIVIDDVTGKSCEQSLITKECIQIQFFCLNRLYTVVVKLFKSTVV